MYSYIFFLHYFTLSFTFNTDIGICAQQAQARTTVQTVWPTSLPLLPALTRDVTCSPGALDQ